MHVMSICRECDRKCLIDEFLNDIYISDIVILEIHLLQKLNEFNAEININLMNLFNIYQLVDYLAEYTLHGNNV